MRILSRIVRHYIGTNNFSTKNIFNIYIWCFIFSFEIYQWTDLCIIKCGQSTSPPENQSIARNSSSNWDKRLVITFTTLLYRCSQMVKIQILLSLLLQELGFNFFSYNNLTIKVTNPLEEKCRNNHKLWKDSYYQFSSSMPGLH